MKKYALSFIILTIFASCHHSQLSFKHYEDILLPTLDKKTTISKPLEKSYQATITIIGQDKRRGKPIGSGVILRHKKRKTVLILTSYHVVKNLPKPNSILVKTPENLLPYFFHIVKFDKERDLALLSSRLNADSDGNEVQIAFKKPQQGSVLWVIGTPAGHQNNITKGVLSSVTNLGTKYEYYRTNAEIFYGNSGGGVFNNEGELIGIAMALELYPQGPLSVGIIPGGGLCVSLQTIVNFLTDEMEN